MNALLSTAGLLSSVAETRGQLLKRELLQTDVPQGATLSYPVPRQSGAGTVLAHFLYGAPVVLGANDRLLSRPRFWLLAAPRSPRILLFADCRIEDFTPDGYMDATWPRPETAASSVADLQEMERQLLSALDCFLDEAFADPDALSEAVQDALAIYDGLIHRLTPDPMTPFLLAISPEFWKWASAVLNNRK